MIAAVLDDPAPHADATYPLFGPVERDHHGIAAEVARALDRPVRYEPVPVEAFAAMLTERGQSAHLIQHLSNVALDYRAGRFAGLGDAVERIGGPPPMDVVDFVAANRHGFAADAGRQG